MKKLFLILLMLLPITASAYDAEIDGIYYLFSGDEAIVTFKESCGGFRYEGDVVIPSQVTYKGKTYRVTRIGINAFYGSKLTSISLPNTIKSIGDGAFNFSSLTEIYLPDNITTIESRAFLSSKLKNVHLPNNLYYMGAFCFSSCEELENINIPSKLHHLGASDFRKCSKIRTDDDGYLGNLLLRVPDKDVVDYKIKEGTKFVQLQAFEGCDKLQSLYIPESVINVDGINNTLPNCLETLVEEVDNIRYIGPIVVGTTNGDITKYTVREGTRFILDYAFYNTQAEEIQLPNTLKYIGRYAISLNSKLKTIVIPKSVVHLDDVFIEYCGNIEKVSVAPGNLYYDSRNDCNAIIDKYTNELVMGCKNSIIPNGVRSIGEGAIFECKIKDLYIPESVSVLKSGCFQESEIENLHIPSSVKEFATSANFSDNENVFFDNYESICYRSFDYGGGITLSYAPKPHLFIGGKEVMDIVIPNGIEHVSGLSFYRFIYVNSLTLPASVNYIGPFAFDDCPFKYIKCYAENPPAVSKYDGTTLTFLGIDKSIPLYVPASSIDAYKSAEGWKEFTNILPISVDVTDGDEYENTKEESNQIINYTRTFTNTNWQAIYVPFSMNYADWSKDFEVARINDAHQWDDDDDGIIDRTQLEVIKIKSGWTEPNTPYLIRAKEAGEKVITVKDATLYKTEENTFDVTSWNTKFSFTGTYKTISGMDMKANGYYAMSNGKLVQAASTSSDLKPFRWYLDVTDRDGNKKNVNEVKIYVFGDDEDFETDVDLATENGKKDENVFDLSGRKVINAKAGIYVKNGKKYVVK
ncbi:MAG: leucine-rich repeat domain-containing protein [Bacteroidaceae bacterium]|nr:leucine-rich repeat domain-containing protein [Bacteroidaceae bacterium]